MHEHGAEISPESRLEALMQFGGQWLSAGPADAREAMLHVGFDAVG